MSSDRIRRLFLLLVTAAVLVGGLAACGDDDTEGTDTGDDQQDGANVDIDSGGDDSEGADGPLAFGTVTVDGDTLSEDPDGESAPVIASETDEGTVSIDPADGTPRVMVFLAHWCPHCQAEVPVIVDAAADGVFDDVELVGVLTGTNPDAPNYPPSEWLDDEGWTGVEFYDDEDATAGLAYGLSGFPMIVFVDGDGVVQERLTGEQPVAAIEAGVKAISS